MKFAQPLILVLLGAAAVMKVARNPQVEAFHSVNVLSLMASARVSAQHSPLSSVFFGWVGLGERRSVSPAKRRRGGPATAHGRPLWSRLPGC